ncbi:MAG: hypothetical protein FJ301_06605 [Planctomycetes bacterium]|nr:hypothetical protein [Planctomycetota bacterium]
MSSSARLQSLSAAATVGRAAGFSLVEFLIGLVILVISSTALLNHLTINYQTTASERDRVFAFSKAQAMLAEIQNHCDRTGLDAAEVDEFDDGVTTRPQLTVQRAESGLPLPADHALSGNLLRGGQWLWSRNITVQPMPGIGGRNLRYVTVRVLRRDADGTERSLADLSAVVSSAGDAYPTTQVYDVFLLALENVPGWWVHMDSLRPFVESRLDSLEARNPGLQFRTHWITKSSIGRNAAYRPRTNDATPSTDLAPFVYCYPGRMPTGSASQFYYVPDNLTGRIDLDGVDTNGYDANRNPHPYALADGFNHAARLPDELAAWTRRVAAIEQREALIAQANAGGFEAPEELADMSKEPTLRLFLEDLWSSPDKYRHALVINLHGELLPMPPVRNYSDAAKSPIAHPDLRVVTHPEELRTRNKDGGQTDALRFRMYAYAHETLSAPYAGPSRMADPMVVEFVGVNLTDNGDPTRLAAFCALQNAPGGVPVSGSSNYALAWQTAKHVSDTPATGEMHYVAQWVPPTLGQEGFTRVFLHNTPVGAPPVTQGGQQYGLAATKRARLYGMAYVPCPLSAPAAAMPTFTPDLTSSGAGPKNTARWTLAIGAQVLTGSRFVQPSGAPYDPAGDVVLAVRTRIARGHSAGDDSWRDGGVMWPTPNDPDNLSVTYAWWTNSAQDVPVTERAQIQGDPRHLPYRDCFRNGGDFPNSYNWYLTDLTSGSGAWAESAVADFPSIDASMLRDGWAAGTMGFDVPRCLQLFREGLVRSGSVYTSITGWSNYYVGLGGEIGYDAANGYPNSIPTDLTPFGSPATSGFVNTITGARRFVRASGSGFWWGIPWLGELYPDAAAAAWLDTTSGAARGNLPAGLAAGQFHQQACNAAYAASARQAFGTALVDTGHRSAAYGCTTFFNIGTSASTFQHSTSTSDGTLSSIGQELAANYGTTAPASIPVARPYRLNASTTVGEHWSLVPHAAKGTAAAFQTYITHSGGTGAGVVKLFDPANTAAAYVAVNGIANTVTNGTSFIAEWSILSMLHTMLEAGRSTNSFRIQPQPRIEIESPTSVSELDNPSSINVVVATEWRRWDGRPYTATGTFGESESLLRYAVMCSRDGGRSWVHVADGAPATPGVPPGPAHEFLDQGPGDETFAWDVSSGYPEGVYLLRVECFRVGSACHHAAHQTRVFVQR